VFLRKQYLTVLTDTMCVCVCVNDEPEYVIMIILENMYRRVVRIT